MKRVYSSTATAYEQALFVLGVVGAVDGRTKSHHGWWWPGLPVSCSSMKCIICNTVMVDRDWWIAWLDLYRFDDGRYIFAIHTKGTTSYKSLRRQVFDDRRRCVIIVEVDVVASVHG